MKKICYIVTLPHTIKAFFIPQLKYLSEHGYDVTVICNFDYDLQSDLGENMKYIPLEIPRGISFYGSIKIIKQLINIFKKENFDLIQYSTPNAAFYSAVAGKISNCPIRNYHCMGFRYLGFEGIVKLIFKLIEKLTCKLSTHIECVSKSNLDLGVLEKIFLKDKATIVFNGSTGGVDLNKFNITYREMWRKAIRVKYGLINEDFIYGFVGRITRDKGVNELLDAFFLLRNDAKLLLIGEVEENNNLDPTLFKKAQNCEDIIFTGKVDDVEKYFSAIDILVLPSYREGFGNVVIEAEAMGTPVIVSNIPGPIDTILEGVTGKTVLPKDSINLKETMQEMQLEFNENNYIKKCHEYVKNSFDSNLLCEQILKRKQFLLKVYDE